MSRHEDVHTIALDVSQRHSKQIGSRQCNVESNVEVKEEVQSVCQDVPSCAKIDDCMALDHPL